MDFPIKALFEQISAIQPPNLPVFDPVWNATHIDPEGDELTESNIFASIRSAEQYRSSLSQAEDGIRSLLEYMTAENSKASVYIRTHKEFIRSPLISSLPTDILSEVFLVVRQLEYRDLGDLYFSHRDVYSIPSTITAQVCHDWRELSLSMTCLWSRIIIDKPPLRKTGSKDGTVRLARLFLERSGIAPLTMSIRTNRWCPLTFDLIQMSDASRWERIQLWLTDRYFRQATILSEESSFPQLVTCSIAVIDAAFAELSLPPPIVPKLLSFRQAPKLQLLTLPQSQHHGVRGVVHFDQLPTLRACCGSFTVTELQQLFHSSKDLRRCHFLGPYPGVHEDMPVGSNIESIPSHPNLDTLLFSYDIPSSLSSRLPSSLPGLRHLSLTYLKGNMATQIAKVVPLFALYGSQLRTVVFPDWQISNDMRDCLQHCESLTTLAFTFNGPLLVFPGPATEMEISVLSGLTTLETLAFGVFRLVQAEWAIDTWKKSGPSRKLKLYIGAGMIPEGQFETESQRLEELGLKNSSVEIIMIRSGWDIDWQLMCNHLRTGEWRCALTS